MRYSKYLVALSILSSAFSAHAQLATIDFEGVNSFGAIDNYYNGGTDAAGNTGANYGVSFTPSAQGLSNDVLGTYFSNAPTPGGVMFAPDESAFLNSALGFSGTVSLYYSSAVDALNSINIYSGLNGTGDLLASISLTANAAAGGCSDSAFCHFDNVGVAFAGTARSINFGSNGGLVAYDNVVLNPVPEPTGYALMALGLAGLGRVARRRSA